MTIASCCCCGVSFFPQRTCSCNNLRACRSDIAPGLETAAVAAAAIAAGVETELFNFDETAAGAGPALVVTIDATPGPGAAAS